MWKLTTEREEGLYIFSVSSLVPLPIRFNTFLFQAVFIRHLLSASNRERTRVPASRIITIQKMRWASKPTVANQWDRCLDKFVHKKCWLYTELLCVRDCFRGKVIGEGFLEAVTLESQRMSRSQLIQGVDRGNALMGTIGNKWTDSDKCAVWSMDGRGCLNVRAGICQV